MKIAINGMGRIGRTAFKIAYDRKGVEIVGVNDLSEPDPIAYLAQHDSVYGIWDHKIKAGNKTLVVDDKKIPYFQEAEPEKLPWKDLAVDVVLECTGVFTNSEKAGKHLTAGAK